MSKCSYDLDEEIQVYGTVGTFTTVNYGTTTYIKADDYLENIYEDIFLEKPEVGSAPEIETLVEHVESCVCGSEIRTEAELGTHNTQIKQTQSQICRHRDNQNKINYSTKDEGSMRKILPTPKKPNKTQIFNQLLCVDKVKTFSKPEQNSDAHGKIVSAALIDQPSKDVSDTPVAPKTPVNDNPEPSENSGRVKDLETQVLLLKRQLFSATIKNSNQEKLIRKLRSSEKSKLSQISSQLLELQIALRQRDREIATKLANKNKILESQKKLIEDLMFSQKSATKVNYFEKSQYKPSVKIEDFMFPSIKHIKNIRSYSGNSSISVRSDDSDSGVVLDTEIQKDDTRVIRSISDVVKNSRVGKLFSRDLHFSNITESECESTLSINSEIELRTSHLFSESHSYQPPGNRVYLNHRCFIKPKDVKYRRITKTKSKSMDELRQQLRIDSVGQDVLDSRS